VNSGNLTLKGGKMKIMIAVILSVQVIFTCLYAQDRYVVRHNSSGGTSGVFSISPDNDENYTNKGNIKATVNEIEISFSGSKEITLMIIAAITEEKLPDLSISGSSAAIKSYADPDYQREVKYEVSGEGSESGEIERVQDEIADEDVPPRTYVEFKIGENTLEYTFYDKSGLESIVSGVNSSYGTNFQVFGEGRNVSVGNAAPKNEIINRDVSTRIIVTDQNYVEGTHFSKAGIDPRDIRDSLVKDKILTQKSASNFKLSMDQDYIYINGTRVPDRQQSKYRKLFSAFFFVFND
jgi:hypothetical protein